MIGGSDLSHAAGLTAVRRGVHAGWPKGLRLERDPGVGISATQFRLFGRPWMPQNNDEFYSRSLLCHTTLALLEAGLRPVVSADVSSKFRGATDDSQVDFPIDAHSWWVVPVVPDDESQEEEMTSGFSTMCGIRAPTLPFGAVCVDNPLAPPQRSQPPTHPFFYSQVAVSGGSMVAGNSMLDKTSGLKHKRRRKGNVEVDQPARPVPLMRSGGLGDLRVLEDLRGLGDDVGKAANNTVQAIGLAGAAVPMTALKSMKSLLSSGEEETRGSAVVPTSGLTSLGGQIKQGLQGVGVPKAVAGQFSNVMSYAVRATSSSVASMKELRDKSSSRDSLQRSDSFLSPRGLRSRTLSGFRRAERESATFAYAHRGRF